MGLIITALLAETLQGKWRWHVIIDFLHRTENVNSTAIAIQNITKVFQYNKCKNSKANYMCNKLLKEN